MPVSGETPTMRYLAVLVLMGCGTIRFVRPSLPGRPCAEECLAGELECLSGVDDNGSYFLLGPLLLGGISPDRGIRQCELHGRICASQCEHPSHPPPIPPVK